jgi:hypothetical protein
MKTSRYILMAAASLLIGLSNMASARPGISVRLGSGRREFSAGSRNHRNDRRSSFKASHNNRKYSRDYRRHYRRRWRPAISRSVYRYDRNAGYCVAIAPMVIEKQTVVVSTNSPQVVQLQQFDENTLQLNIQLQQRKIELLDKILMPDKEQRINAIRQLAGFSFDDNVRNVLESILLTEPDAELRKEAAQALGKTNNIKVLAALEKARVEDSDKDVRKAADEAIKQLEGN